MNPELPQEIIVPSTELLRDEDGKAYCIIKDGVKYGGDFLEETPEEIDVTMPEAPEVREHVL